MRPLDPRLVRQARAARAFLAGAVICGLAMTALVLAQAGLLAHVIAHASQGIRPLAASLVALAIVLVARAAIAYGGEALALRAAAATKSQLRRKLLRHIMALGPQWLGRRSHGELVALAGRGLDALDPYFARYLPQLVLSIALTLLFSSAVQLLCLGILGEYMGRLFEEAKRRPVYVVRQRIGLAPPDLPAA